MSFMNPVHGWWRGRHRRWAVTAAALTLWLSPDAADGRPDGMIDQQVLGMFSPTASATELRRTPEVTALARCRGAVVNLRGEKRQNESTPARAPGTTGDPERHIGMGTGIVVDSRGYILTNYHVVSDIREIQAVTSENQFYPAKIVARDPDTDLAILKIDSEQPMSVIPIGRSDDLMQGERVIALGNAYGYEHTATFGYISATRRPVQINGAQFYEDLIQTDASINPGNSGGPLLNIDGELIGVNVAVRENAQGIGFAIPVDRAMQVTARLLTKLGEQTAQHGLTIDSETGRVASVAVGSAGETAGVQPGDRIVQIGSLSVTHWLDPLRTLLERNAGESVDLMVEHSDGKTKALAMTLTRPQPITYAGRDETSQTEKRVVAAKYPTESDIALELFGLTLTPVSGEDVEKASNGVYSGGLRVDTVRPGSPSANQSLRPGDLLVGMQIGATQGYKTLRMDDIQAILNRVPADQKKITFFILRERITMRGTFPTGN